MGSRMTKHLSLVVGMKNEGVLKGVQKLKGAMAKFTNAARLGLAKVQAGFKR